MVSWLAALRKTYAFVTSRRVETCGRRDGVEIRGALGSGGIGRDGVVFGGDKTHDAGE